MPERKLAHRLPALVLIFGLALTAVAVHLTRLSVTATQDAAFDRLTERIRRAIEGRIDDHVRILSGVRGTFGAFKQISPVDFERYASQIEAHIHNGALGYGFIRYVRPGELEAYARQQRLQRPDFRIKLQGPGPDYQIVELIEPFERNKAAIGLDIGREINRRAAAEAAAKSGAAVLTSAVQLVQTDDRKVKGFLLLLPVYKSQQAPNASPETHRANLLGWAYTPLVADELLDGILRETDGLVDFEVFENDPSQISNMIYDADQHLAKLPVEGEVNDRFYANRQQNRLVRMSVTGRDWYLRISSNRQFDRSMRNNAPLIVLFAGMVISLLISGLFGTSQRIAGRARALADDMTASLRLREQEMREVLRQLEQQKDALDAHSIVAITDTQGTINYVNRKFEEISGYTERELIGQNHRLLNSGFHPKEFFRGMYRSIAQGQIWHGELCNRARDGHLYWVDTTIVPFFNSAGKPILYVAIRTDITANKLVQAELQEHRDHLQAMVDARTADLRTALQAAQAANLAKSEFISNMSHEMRTPMHGILALADMGKKRAGTLDTDKIADYFQRIHGSATRLMRLVTDVLDLAKLDAFKMDFQLAPTNLVNLVEEALREMEAKAAETNHPLVFESADWTRLAMVDGLRILQVLRNLLLNAIKFSAPDMPVRIVFTPDQLVIEGKSQDAVRIEVIDRGVGVPDAELESIFESFVQSSHTKTGAGGTGLGLAISRQIVERHGGWIRVTNRPEGGAIFAFTLPLTAEG